jgi:hypothetical protein
MTLEGSKRIDCKIITDKKITEKRLYNNFGGNVPYIHNNYVHDQLHREK